MGELSDLVKIGTTVFDPQALQDIVQPLQVGLLSHVSSDAGQTRKPKDWLAPGHPARPNGTPLHSAQVAAPFRQPNFVTPQN
jgi:hypothetical protein